MNEGSFFVFTCPVHRCFHAEYCEICFSFDLNAYACLALCLSQIKVLISIYVAKLEIQETLTS